jgi:hypothetical protein
MNGLSGDSEGVGDLHHRRVGLNAQDRAITLLCHV